MRNKKECCKRICENCTHKNEPLWLQPLCKVVDEQKLNCVTGQSEIVYLDPYEINKNGDCPYYNESKQKVLWNKIKELLEEYDREIFMKYHGDYTGWSEYSAMDGLSKVLDKPRVWKDNDNQCSEPAKKKGWWNAYCGLMSKK